MKKIYITIFMIIAIMIITPMEVYARQDESTDGSVTHPSSSTPSSSTSDIINPDTFDPDNYDDGDSSELMEKAGIIVGVIRGIGTLVSIGALMVIGIRTMTASVEEKAVYKQALPGYIFGAIMVMAMTWLPTLIYKLAGQL